MRNIVDEILEKKSRNVPIGEWVQPSRPRWESVSSRISSIGAISKAVNVLEFVCNKEKIGEVIQEVDGTISDQRSAIILNGGVFNEISRYIPIGLVACMEAYFRQAYADLINHGDPYKQNAATFSDIKFNIQTAISLERADLSIGDFISHFLPISSFESIESTMTKLVGKSFSEILQKEIENSNELQQPEFMLGNREDYISRGYKVMSSALVVPTHQKIYRDMVCGIRDVFELRHRLCHEASSIALDSDDFIIEKAYSTVLRFLVVSEAAIEKMLLGED